MLVVEVFGVVVAGEVAVAVAVAIAVAAAIVNRSSSSIASAVAGYARPYLSIISRRYSK